MRLKTILLGLILLLGAVLRFYNLGLVPASLEWDEVALGYDAYSILKTGRDQYGTFLPSTFRSLDDWKPPIYEYLTVPSVAIFGLTSFAARLPSALFGTLSILATYWLVKTIFFFCSFTSGGAPLSPVKASSGHPRGVLVALLSAFLLAVSPWHLQFSRAAFEVNVSVFITILAVTAFIKGIRDSRFFLLSGVLFGLDLFSYHSTRIVAPLLLISLFILFNKVLPARKITLGFLLIFGFFVLNFIPIVRSPEAQIRFKATNIFNPGARYLDERDLDREFLEKRQLDGVIGFEQAGKIFHNRRLIYSDYETFRKALSHYLSNFGFEFLFVKGDAPLHHAPGFGLLHVWEFPFILAGIYILLKKGINKYTLILPLWLLFVPIPDAVTREAPHAVRSELFLPVWQIFGALGIAGCLDILNRQSGWVRMLLVVSSVAFFTFNHGYYLHQYYVHTDYELSENWKYGREEAVKYTESLKNGYDKVLISLKVDMPYIFWLFYSQYSPEKLQKEGGLVSGGFADERNKFDKYEFRNFTYNNLPTEKKLLLVSIPEDFPPDADIIRRIYYRNGKSALTIARNK